MPPPARDPGRSPPTEAPQAGSARENRSHNKLVYQANRSLAPSFSGSNLNLSKITSERYLLIFTVYYS
uniref:Uncharacterized protein n=1 Tax=Triticum urartu TaxID=4572 RepID=A0A8R7PKQ3_TRIUA